MIYEEKIIELSSIAYFDYIQHICKYLESHDYYLKVSKIGRSRRIWSSSNYQDSIEVHEGLLVF